MRLMAVILVNPAAAAANYLLYIQELYMRICLDGHNIR